jgi:hypothetical protein
LVCPQHCPKLEARKRIQWQCQRRCLLSSLKCLERCFLYREGCTVCPGKHVTCTRQTCVYQSISRLQDSGLLEACTDAGHSDHTIFKLNSERASPQRLTCSSVSICHAKVPNLPGLPTVSAGAEGVLPKAHSRQSANAGPSWLGAKHAAWDGGWRNGGASRQGR